MIHEFVLGAPLVLALGAGAETVPVDSDRWQIEARESRVVDHLGRRSLLLKGGSALVKDSRFTDGVIEFDMAFGPERGFMGAVWRCRDMRNCENFYIRPHQAGNPDANQYQPVFNGISAWQLYHGERYGSPLRYRFDQWVHLKIVVSGAEAEFYVDDMNAPALVVGEQKRPLGAGMVGLNAGNFAPAYYSNFSFTTAQRPVLKGRPARPAAPPPGAVMSWLVSDTFGAKTLEGRHELGEADTRGLRWSRLASEPSGIANLARLQGISDDKETAFARIVIASVRDQVKRLRFGFSDAVKVYLNGRAIYAGRDAYQSRDYRFLGSVGLWDELFLPLRSGDNELWMAVTEDLGGWGVVAAFEDLEGIEIVDRGSGGQAKEPQR